MKRARQAHGTERGLVGFYFYFLLVFRGWGGGWGRRGGRTAQAIGGKFRSTGQNIVHAFGKIVGEGRTLEGRKQLYCISLSTHGHSALTDPLLAGAGQLKRRGSLYRPNRRCGQSAEFYPIPFFR